MPLMLAALALAACARANENRESVTPDAEVRVKVTNDAFWDANIYLMRGSSRARLGTVNGHSTNTFVLPRQMMLGLTEIRFIVDWIGRRDAEASETIVAEPGDEIELIIR
jgi:hypothetical protein